MESGFFVTTVKTDEQLPGSKNPNPSMCAQENMVDEGHDPIDYRKHN